MRKDGRLRHAHGYTSISLIMAVLAGSGLVAAGHVPVSTLLDLADGSAWLGNLKRGTLTLVNGSSGRASATVGVGANGHRLQVTQTGNGVIVTDLDTGELRRIDSTDLSVSQAVAYDVTDLDVVQQGTTTYAVDHRRGRVIRLDPTTLRPLGDVVALPGPLTSNVVFDRDGVLWVAVARSGAIYPIDDGRLGQPIDVGAANASPLLSVVNGHLTVVVAERRSLLVLRGNRIASTFTVPEIAVGAPLAPIEAAGQVLPLVSAAASRLVTLDTVTGMRRSSVFDRRFRGHDLGAPLILSSRVFVPDYSIGSVVVYDSAAGRFTGTIRATRHKGKFDAFIKGNYLWLNDQSGSRAVVVDANGRRRDIDKYAVDVARPRPAWQGKDPRLQPGRGPAVGPGVGTSLPPPTGPGPAPTGPKTATSPGVPRSVKASPGDESIAVSWVAPAGGGKVGYYVATAHPVNGAPDVTARTRHAATSIVIEKLENHATYTVTIEAVNSMGHSPPSPPTRPVTPLPGLPLPPTLVSVTPVVGTGTVNVVWEPSTEPSLQSIQGYYVYLKDGSGAPVGPATTVEGATSTQLHGLTKGASYTVEVSAYTVSRTETAAKASERFRVPREPDAPTIERFRPDVYHVRLSWSVPDDGGAPVQGYTVHYGTDRVERTPIPTHDTSIVIGPLRADKTFTFTVVAHNAVGDSPRSREWGTIPVAGQYANWDHYRWPASIRSAPRADSGLVGQLPVVPTGQEGERMPLFCQAPGQYFTDPGNGMRSHIWDYINYHGRVGYVNDMYIHTPNWNRDQFSPGIPQC